MKWLFLGIAVLTMTAVMAYAQVGGLTNSAINTTGGAQVPSWQPDYIPQGGTYVTPTNFLMFVTNGKITLNGGGSVLCNAC